VRFCVLRNYEGFPAKNVGSDIDFLITPSELPGAIRALASIEGIRIIGFAERYYVAHLFVEGVSTAPGVRCLGIDFIWSLNWKGITYLPTDMLLEAATQRQVNDETYLVPSPAHEAIISLLSSLLVGGWLKEKYFPKVHKIFTDNRCNVFAALRPAFGDKPATQLVSAVIEGDRPKMLKCVSSLRILLVLRSLLRRPIRSIRAVFGYHKREFAVRCTPQTLETVCISDPDGLNKAANLEHELISMLQYSAKHIERRRFGLGVSPALNSPEEIANADLRFTAQCHSVATISEIVLCMAKEWLSRFKKKDNLTLRIYAEYYHDLLIVPQSYHYCGPMWFARLVGGLIPSFNLWILLDAAPDASQSEITQLMPVENLRQLKAYRSFVITRKKYVILDARMSTARLAEDMYIAIVDMLAQRADRQLKRRLSASVCR